MEILDNPFHILRATLRDDRRKIMERAEERSLIEDADQCSRARAILTHPKKRLAAELAWLPGLSPKRTAASIQVLKSDISKVTILESLPPLARSNLYAAALPRIAGSVSADRLIEWIISMSNASEQIDAVSITNLLNEDRSVAGFPEIPDVTAVEEQLNDQWKVYQNSVKQALDQRESQELVDIVTRVVDEATNKGTRHAPALLDDIVDRYEIEAHGFLEQEAENVVTVLACILHE